MSLPLPIHRTRSTRPADCGPGRGDGDDEQVWRKTLHLRKSSRDGGLIGAGADASERGPVLQPGPMGASGVERRGLKHRATAGCLRLMSAVHT